MAKRNKSILPGLVGKDTKSLSLDGIKNALNTRGSSALPVMKYFGDVKPSRNERIIKPKFPNTKWRSSSVIFNHDILCYDIENR